ncbi:uncharacterized protein LOC118763794 [Octopus sinensis]|uniref:Uncharacterized protein LOC118763794 n=1 Tax=Octopus sinensis TaxID=2607531 RepID=A0A7E6EWV6_9MOLL|nr:uncharacterized protein LOC118763794 [Octopus sinensis]
MHQPCRLHPSKNIIMADAQLTQERKKHAANVVIKVEYNDLEISRFLKVARSFVYKVCKELETEDGNVSPVSKHKKHSKCSEIIRTHEFIQQVQQTIDYIPRKLMRSVGKDLHVSEGTVRNVVQEGIRYKSHTMRKSQFVRKSKRKSLHQI